MKLWSALKLLLYPLAWVAFVALLAAACCAQEPRTPDSHGELILDPPPAYRGNSAVQVLPPYTIRNEGSDVDGAGLCVDSSILANGMYQGVADLRTPGKDGRTGKMVPGKGSKLWLTVKKLPGGSYPEKLNRIVSKLYPGEKWESYYGKDRRFLDKWSREGYPIGATMNTGRQYGYQRIAHMISLLYYRTGGWACVLDNNFPTVYSWLPAKVFDQRWLDEMGNGWGWRWLKKPALAAATGGLFAFSCVATAIVIIIGAPKRRGESHA